MIVLKSSRELELMKEACQISAEALMVAGEAVKPGASTKEIDEIAYKFIKKHGATPNFLNYGGFPATACISINDEVIHGIPRADRILKEGDIVSIDLGAAKNGYNGDNAATFACGTVSDEAKRLMDTTRESFIKVLSKQFQATESAISVTQYRSIAKHVGTALYVTLSVTASVLSFMKNQAYQTSVTQAVVSDCYPE